MAPTRKQLIQGYIDLMTRYLDRGFEPTLMSIMFNQLGGSEASYPAKMRIAVEQVYSRMLGQAYRRVRSEELCNLPMWILCYDWPVPKGAGFSRDHFINIKINGGLHFHGFGLTPPYTRLRCALDLHLNSRPDLYTPERGIIHRIHAAPITSEPDYVLRYVLKSVERQRVGVEDVIILPKHHSEMAR